jgi:hypothetical protein
MVFRCLIVKSPNSNAFTFKIQTFVFNELAGSTLNEMRGHYVCHPAFPFLKTRDQLSDLHRTTIMLEFCIF